MIPNEVKEAILKEEIRARGLFLMEQFKQMAQEGPPLPGRRGTPVQRLLQYLKDTAPDEMAMAFTPDYPALVDAGGAPEPVPHVWYVVRGGRQVPWFDDGTGVPKVRPFTSDREAMQAAEALGIPPNPDGSPPVEPHLNFWSLLLQLPVKWEWNPWQYHSKDFLGLFNQFAQKVEAGGTA